MKTGEVIFLNDGSPEALRFLRLIASWDQAPVEVKTVRAVLDHFHHDVSVDAVIVPQTSHKTKGGMATIEKVRHLGFSTPFLFFPVTQSDVEPSRIALFRLAATIDDTETSRSIYLKTVEIGRVMRELFISLGELGKRAQMSMEKIESLQKRQERFLVAKLDPVLRQKNL